eukprot:1908818-Amphidinium_carterae.1
MAAFGTTMKVHKASGGVKTERSHSPSRRSSRRRPGLAQRWLGPEHEMKSLQETGASSPDWLQDVLDRLNNLPRTQQKWYFSELLASSFLNCSSLCGLHLVCVFWKTSQQMKHDLRSVVEEI